MTTTIANNFNFLCNDLIRTLYALFHLILTKLHKVGAYFKSLWYDETVQEAK
jgi:hypothetical protein